MSLSNTINVTAGGIDVGSIVSGLMTAERVPLSAILSRQNNVQRQVAGIKGIKSGIESLQSQLSSILSNGLAKYTPSVSNAAAAAVSLSSTARSGAVSFTVDRLASAHGLRTASTVASNTSVVTTASRLAVSTTAKPLGFTSLASSAAVTAGNYTVRVTQATAGASIAGGTAVTGSTVINGANDTLNLTIDGVARTVNIAAGTYAPAGLRAAVQTAIDAAGGGATALLDSANHLKITTTHEGSAASLAITGGSALGSLGMAVTTPAVVGIDGIVRIGTNPSVTVTSAGLGEVVTVSTGTGTLDVTLGAGLRIGDAKVAVVSTGDRSLSAVATAINGANVGATASAVKSADGAWLLQVNSSKSGTANALALDPATFSAAGGLVETSAAQDAKITIGAGPGAYSVTASGNTFTDILPGATITATGLSATPVTVTIGRDDASMATAVDALVAQANTIIGLANDATKYDPATKVVAPLAGDSTVRALAAGIRSAITAPVGGSPGVLAADFGITSLKDGTLKFDKALFLTKLAADPEAVERLFNRHGSNTGGVSFAAATDGTAAGTYSVVVTTAAQRATTGIVLVGGSVAGQRVGVRIGGTTVSYDAAAGASASDVAIGLNAALARAGLNVTAEANGGGVALTATKFGFTGNFESNLDVNGAGSWTSSVGADVQGTINGQAAIGSGQRLSLLGLGRNSARGLAVDIDEGLTGTLASVQYQPGVGARLANLGANLTGTLGVLTTSTGAYEAKVRDFNDQVSKFEARLTVKEANYRRQWTAVQTSLNSLQNQQSWITQQITSLNAKSG